MEYGAKSNKGDSRNGNEDSYYLDDGERYYIVADGVGGAAGGEVASSSAISKAVDYLKNSLALNKAGDKEIEEEIEKSIDEANRYILELAEKNPEYSGMGTTFVLLYLDKGNAYFANLGDSRAYLIRGGEITQISNDHTLSAELARRGEISLEEVDNHPQSNVITRALGMDLKIKPEMHKLIIFEDDIIVLCSDGIYNVLSNQEIIQIFIEGKDVQESCDVAVEKVEERQGKDDKTILAVKVRGEF